MNTSLPGTCSSVSALQAAIAAGSPLPANTADLLTGRGKGLIILAHRGCCGESIPENSIPAFRSTLQKGLHGWECDVQLTRDGIPVILHQGTRGKAEALELKTTGKGLLKSHTLAELERVRLVIRSKAAIPTITDEPIPTLQSALDVAKENEETIVQVHIEEAGFTNPVMSLLSQNNFLARATVSSKSGESTRSALEILSQVRLRSSDISTALILSPRSSDKFPRDRASTRELVAAAQDAGVTLFDLSLRNSWTLLTNEIAEIVLESGIGITAGFEMLTVEAAMRMISIGADRIICNCLA